MKFFIRIDAVLTTTLILGTSTINTLPQRQWLPEIDQQEWSADGYYYQQNQDLPRLHFSHDGHEPPRIFKDRSNDGLDEIHPEFSQIPPSVVHPNHPRYAEILKFYDANQNGQILTTKDGSIVKIVHVPLSSQPGPKLINFGVDRDGSGIFEGNEENDKSLIGTKQQDSRELGEDEAVKRSSQGTSFLNASPMSMRGRRWPNIRGNIRAQAPIDAQSATSISFDNSNRRELKTGSWEERLATNPETWPEQQKSLPETWHERPESRPGVWFERDQETLESWQGSPVQIHQTRRERAVQSSGRRSEIPELSSETWIDKSEPRPVQSKIHDTRIQEAVSLKEPDNRPNPTSELQSKARHQKHHKSHHKPQIVRDYKPDSEQDYKPIILRDGAMESTVSFTTSPTEITPPDYNPSTTDEDQSNINDYTVNKQSFIKQYTPEISTANEQPLSKNYQSYKKEEDKTVPIENYKLQSKENNKTELKLDQDYEATKSSRRQLEKAHQGRQDDASFEKYDERYNSEQNYKSQPKKDSKPKFQFDQDYKETKTLRGLHEKAHQVQQDDDALGRYNSDQNYKLQSKEDTKPELQFDQDKKATKDHLEQIDITNIELQGDDVNDKNNKKCISKNNHKSLQKEDNIPVQQSDDRKGTKTNQEPNAKSQHRRQDDNLHEKHGERYNSKNDNYKSNPQYNSEPKHLDQDNEATKAYPQRHFKTHQGRQGDVSREEYDERHRNTPNYKLQPKDDIKFELESHLDHKATKTYDERNDKAHQVQQDNNLLEKHDESYANSKKTYNLKLKEYNQPQPQFEKNNEEHERYHESNETFDKSHRKRQHDNLYKTEDKKYQNTQFEQSQNRLATHDDTQDEVDDPDQQDSNNYSQERQTKGTDKKSETITSKTESTKQIKEAEDDTAGGNGKRIEDKNIKTIKTEVSSSREVESSNKLTKPTKSPDGDFWSTIFASFFPKNAPKNKNFNDKEDDLKSRYDDDIATIKSSLPSNGDIISGNDNQIDFISIIASHINNSDELKKIFDVSPIQDFIDFVVDPVLPVIDEIQSFFEKINKVVL